MSRINVTKIKVGDLMTCRVGRTFRCDKRPFNPVGYEGGVFKIECSEKNSDGAWSSEGAYTLRVDINGKWVHGDDNAPFTILLINGNKSNIQPAQPKESGLKKLIGAS